MIVLDNSRSKLVSLVYSPENSHRVLVLYVLYQNFYIEHPEVSKRSEDETSKWRQQCGIVIQGDGIPKPALTFEEASMPEYVLKEVMKQGFERPTPIQSQGWPMALLGRDMVGISATGSGKTLAFLLPAMIHINAQVWHDFLYPPPPPFAPSLSSPTSSFQGNRAPSPIQRGSNPACDEYSLAL